MRTEADLRPAQVRTIVELMESAGVQAVLGMGAGKTVAALTAIRKLLDAGTIRAAIITAPVRVALSTWPGEIAGWEHLRGLDYTVLQGPPAKRLAKLKEQHQVYIVSIDNLVWLLGALASYATTDARWDQLVIDELSRFKSPRGERAKVLRKQASKFKSIWGLTGTPRPNSEEDLWMPLQLVSANEAFDKSFDDWRRSNFMPLDPNGYSWRIHKFARNDLARLVDQWSFTIPAHEVTDVPFNSGDDFDTFVDLTPEATRDLGTMEKELLVELGLGTVDLRNPDEDVMFALSKAVASGKMTQLMQGFLYREGQTLQTYDNPKMDALAEMLEQAGGDNVLVPYYFKEDMTALRGRFGDKLPCLGAGTSDKEAARLIDAWNAGDIPVLPIHPASAGHGLNLQFGGHNMFWYHMTWSAELYIQTCKRLARPGQRNPVYSRRIRARHWLEDLRVNRVEAKIKEETEFMQRMRTI